MPVGNIYAVSGLKETTKINARNRWTGHRFLVFWAAWDYGGRITAAPRISLVRNARLMENPRLRRRGDSP
jgi:hypothetical protein